MLDLIQSLLGGYTPLVDDNGNIIGGIAGLNYDYLIGALIFILCLVWVGLMIRSLLVHILD